MSRFHRYSVNNTMLIYMQKPDATLVAGYNKWKDQFERHVKKGEHGLSLIHIYKELKTLNEDGEIGLARLFSIWANMMCAHGAATIVGCRPITMLSEILAQVHAYLTVHPLYGHAESSSHQ